MVSFRRILSAERFLFLKLLLAWFALNILQAAFTEIGNDEAYYWIYSQYLAWGYYDHPPMVGLVIYLGTLLFDGELGVRFFTALIQLPFLLIVFKLIDAEPTKKAIWLFFTVAFSVVMIQAYGFISAPDGPMLLFAAVFLLAYKRFIERDDTGNILLLGLSMALMLYSKYHGVLFIGFVVLSNLRLLLNYKFYISGVFALALLSPHIVWQVNNGFPSITYHLFQRSSFFHLDYFFEFLANQLAVFNPLTLGALFYVLFKRKTHDLFERALVFIVVGFFVFFTLSNFKGYVNPHWTVALSIALIILVVKEALVNEKLRRFTFKWIAPSLVLLMAARFFLVFDILPIKTEWHGHKQRMLSLKEVVNGTPLVVFNQFQLPSKYMFYAQQPVHSLGGVRYRDTQFDIWQFDEQFRNDTVVVLSSSRNKHATKYSNNGYDFFLTIVPDFQPYKNIEVQVDTASITFTAGETVQLPIRVFNTYGYNFNFSHATMPVNFTVVFNNSYKVFKTTKATAELSKTVLAPNESTNGVLSFDIPSKYSGEYKMWVCLKAPNFIETTATPYIQVNVK